MCKHRETAIKEFKTLCAPIKFSFMFLTIIFFGPRIGSLKSKTEYFF